MIEKDLIINFQNNVQYNMLFGNFDKNMEQIRKTLTVGICVNENDIRVFSDDEVNVNLAIDTIDCLIKIVNFGQEIDSDHVSYVIQMCKDGKKDEVLSALSDIVAVTKKGQTIKCKTAIQRKYIKAIRDNVIVFCDGPAGTGKTYLAIAMAVDAFKNKKVERIILTRPAVEAGESLGFLPGDLQEKVDPYLTPLYDALIEFLGEDKFAKLLERGIIEVAPLAFMRGRTLKNSFVVLDEAQNCTKAQMKMFLTRLGEYSKIVVTGDNTQIDLPKSSLSGFGHAIDILNNIENINIIRFTKSDVVRHPLVQKIIEAYEQ